MRREGSSDRSVGSDRSVRSSNQNRLRPGGGYRRLRSFRVATIVYDATVAFCERYVDRRSRTFDQMVQAARSGRQNIAEGSRASGASSQTELRLVGVARASLDELLLDYEDFLRQRGLRQWAKDDREARAVRAVRLVDQSDQTDPSDRSDHTAYASWLDHRNPAEAANTLICLIHQANYLLDRQLAALERDFINEGGYTEQLAAARIAARGRQHDNVPPAPECPLCARPMVVRTARKGEQPGSQFWGCSNFPACRGTRPLDRSD